MLELYANIKSLRAQLKMSQEELAKKTGYSDRSSIAKIERGDVDLPQSKISLFASALGVTPRELMGDTGVSNRASVRIPVLGQVAAGIPINMVEEIIDYEEIPEDMASRGEYFGLVIHGDSMEPKISEGDIVIVRCQEDVESGQLAIVTVNGDSATCKRVMKYANCIALLSTNPKYGPMQYTPEQIETLPVRILGKVVELRAKFE